MKMFFPPNCSKHPLHFASLLMLESILSVFTNHFSYTLFFIALNRSDSIRDRDSWPPLLFTNNRFYEIKVIFFVNNLLNTAPQHQLCALRYRPIVQI